MPKPTNQSSAFDFAVIQRQWIQDGKPTGFFGNFREDTNECLGVTSERYGVLQNGDLLKTAYAALESRGLRDYEENIIVTEKGKRLYATFTFKDKNLANAVGDVFGYRLILKNSFDCSLRASIALGFLRLTCLNGASTLEKEFGIAEKHSQKISVGFIGKAIDAALDNGGKALRVYDELAEQPISDEQGVNILKRFESTHVLSGVLRESIETLWLAPRRQEDKARNCYNLYNAVTEHLTHQVEKERFEYAQKTSAQILMRLVNAVRRRDMFDKLIAPIPADVAAVLSEL